MFSQKAINPIGIFPRRIQKKQSSVETGIGVNLDVRALLFEHGIFFYPSIPIQKTNLSRNK
jgi:hypothetical protein